MSMAKMNTGKVTTVFNDHIQYDRNTPNDFLSGNMQGVCLYPWRCPCQTHSSSTFLHLKSNTVIFENTLRVTLKLYKQMMSQAQ